MIFALETLTATARSLSSGTMAGLIGDSSYAAVEEVQADFVAWCARQDDQAQPWQAVWKTFWSHAQPRTPSMADLCAQIHAAETAEAAKRARERMEVTLQGKQAPRKSQAPPVGLFAQEQGSLW